MKRQPHECMTFDFDARFHSIWLTRRIQSRDNRHGRICLGNTVSVISSLRHAHCVRPRAFACRVIVELHWAARADNARPVLAPAVKARICEKFLRTSRCREHKQRKNNGLHCLSLRSSSETVNAPTGVLARRPKAVGWLR